MCISVSICDSAKAPLCYMSSTLLAVIKCGDIDLSRLCEEGNKQGGKLKDGADAVQPNDTTSGSLWPWAEWERARNSLLRIFCALEGTRVERRQTGKSMRSGDRR